MLRCACEPPRLTSVWEPAARGDLRRLDRDTAMRILLALTRYGEVGDGDGDAKRLTDRKISIGCEWESGGYSSISMPRAKRVLTVSTIGGKRINGRSFAEPQKVVRGRAGPIDHLTTQPLQSKLRRICRRLGLLILGGKQRRGRSRCCNPPGGSGRGQSPNGAWG